jgi:FMN phosphatase YigB (HAD superfamily)
MVKVALVDVGGTLWPDVWDSRGNEGQVLVRRLRERVPRLSQLSAEGIVGALSAAKHPPVARQQTDRLVADVLRRFELAELVRPEAVIDAMCLPAAGRAELFPGAARLLAMLADRARVVIVSNVMWRHRAAQRADFEDFGVADCVADYVMSLDVGWRKPHRQFFDAALATCGSSATEFLMVGDSETNDIEPAVALGMTAVRVSIEQPMPASSAAHHVCASLDEVTDRLSDETVGRAGDI